MSNPTFGLGCRDTLLMISKKVVSPYFVHLEIDISAGRRLEQIASLTPSGGLPVKNLPRHSKKPATSNRLASRSVLTRRDSRCWRLLRGRGGCRRLPLRCPVDARIFLCLRWLSCGGARLPGSLACRGAACSVQWLRFRTYTTAMCSTGGGGLVRQ